MATLQSNNPFLHVDDRARLRLSAPVIRKPVPTVNILPAANTGLDLRTINEFEEELAPLNKLQERPATLNGGSVSSPNHEDCKNEAGTITICRVPTSSTSFTTSPNTRPPRLDTPIVVPGVCIHAKLYQHPLGLPFIRAYAECLSAYDISEENFATFIDELNLFNRGHAQTFKNVSRVGKAVHLAGHFDPTGITKLVGSGIQLTGQLGSWASIEGPLSRKKSYLETTNEALFHPRGLHVEVIDTAELRKRLNLSKDEPLTLPLNPNWVVPTADQLKAGQRCAPRAPHRILHALRDHVQPVKLLREGNPLANPLAPEFSVNDMFFADAPSLDDTTRKQQSSKNAREVRNIQVGTELIMQSARRDAVALLRAANAVTGTTEKEIKMKLKLLRKAKEKDLEVHATKKMKWLFIANL